MIRRSVPTDLAAGSQRGLRDSPVKVDLILVGVVAAYVALAAFLQTTGPPHREIVVLWQQVRPVFLVFALLTILVLALDVLRSGKSLTSAAGWKDLSGRCLRARSVLRWFVACILFWPFMDVFGWYKSRIDLSAPNLWDPAIVRLEGLLHFGRQPWEWLQPVLGHPVVTRALDLFYHQVYPAVILFVVIGFALAGTGVRRARYLVLFVVTWIVVGTIGGTVFASVGPCYYGLTFPDAPDPFGPLMSYLQTVHAVTPLAAIRSQNFLWAGHMGLATPLGVSAMPSVHVGLATLVMLAAFDYGWWVRIPSVLFWLATLVGSVATGWHYAADGYAATLIVVAVWLAASQFWRRLESG